MFPESGGGYFAEEDAGFFGFRQAPVDLVDGAHEGVAQLAFGAWANVGESKGMAEFVNGSLDGSLVESRGGEVGFDVDELFVGGIFIHGNATRFSSTSLKAFDARVVVKDPEDDGWSALFKTELVGCSIDGHGIEFWESYPAGRVEELALDDGDSYFPLFVASEDLCSFDGAFPPLEFAGEEVFCSECQ